VIALDTSILIRYAVGDDPAQSAAAARFIEYELTPESPGFVSLVAVVELSWVLRKVYGAPAEAVTNLLQTLLSSPQIVVENSEALERALARTECGLPDALIHEVGAGAGCERTVTFDRRFARQPGVELLGPVLRGG
jgi:predicted nucleic-acid-binding protein